MLPIDEITKDLEDLKASGWIERELLSDQEEGEVPLGTITPRAQQLMTLSVDYQRRCDLGLHTALYEAGTKAERKQLEAQARRYKALAEMVRNLAWIEAHDSVEGGWNADVTQIRKGWVMISGKEEPGIEILGSIPVTLETVKHVQGLIKKMVQAREAGAPEDELLKEKRKVQ